MARKEHRGDMEEYRDLGSNARTRWAYSHMTLISDFIMWIPRQVVVSIEYLEDIVMYWNGPFKLEEDVAKNHDDE